MTGPGPVGPAAGACIRVAARAAGTVFEVLDLDCLSTPEARAAFCAWQGADGPAMLAAAHGRASRAVAAWNVTCLEPLSGGSMSLIAAGTAGGRRVVVKASLDPDATAGERVALTRLPGCPELLDAREGVLLLEYVPGSPVTGVDADALAQAVLALHGGGPHRHDDLSTWEAMQELVVGQWARSLPAVFPAAKQVLREYAQALPVALALPRTACHGDLWPKNLLRSPDGAVRVVDPFGIAAPAGWDVALAALAAALDGGDAGVVLSAGRQAGVPGIREWLAVAAPLVLSNDRARQPGAAGRVLAVARSAC